MEMKLGAKIPDISCKKKMENGHDLAVMRHNSVLEQYLLNLGDGNCWLVYFSDIIL